MHDHLSFLAIVRLSKVPRSHNRSVFFVLDQVGLQVVFLLFARLRDANDHLLEEKWWQCSQDFFQ
jgi:hypothetical protein